jgi:hypothetical protein
VVSYYDIDCAAGFDPTGTTTVRRTETQMLADAAAFGGSGKPCVSVAGVDDVYIKPAGDYATITAGVIKYYDAAGNLVRTTADLGNFNRIAGGPGGTWVAIEAGDYADCCASHYNFRVTTDNWASNTTVDFNLGGTNTGTIHDVGYAGGSTNKFFIVGGVYTTLGSVKGVLLAPGGSPASFTTSNQDPAGIQYVAEGCNGVMWATGDSGKIVRSTDGGTTWTTFATVGANIWDDIGINPTTGTVIVTDSLAGQAAQRLNSAGSIIAMAGLPTGVEEIEWAGGNNWIARDGSDWYISHDDGATWAQLSNGDPAVAGIPDGHFDCACD